MKFDDFDNMDNITYTVGSIIGYNYGCDEIRYSVYENIQFYRVLKNMSIYELGLDLSQLKELIDQGFIKEINIPFISTYK